MSLRQAFVGLIAIIGQLALLWMVGLVWFAFTLPTPNPDDHRHADAIVVLTGGSERLAGGLQMLSDGMAPVLFISGVNQGVDLPMLLRRAHLEDAVPDERRLTECCIIIGHAAGNTLGNAAETAEWVRGRSPPVHSIWLVTANYHMRRSMAAFAAALPNTQIMPWPVVPHGMGVDEWWQTQTGFSLMTTEYTKYLIMLARQAMEPPRSLKTTP